ncbi:MAG: TonB-dependent receptor [Bacteroidota bacterium]
MKQRLLILALFLFGSLDLFAGETGKIAGRVRDAETAEPLVGISVFLEGTTMGASTDLEGKYTIVSVPPGTYTVIVSGVGFQNKRFTNVKVSIDFTTPLDVQLSTDVIALETIEVEAEAPLIRRDLTSSQTVVDASTIQSLPVESVTQVLTLQAGITQGVGGEIHIRGGRSTEILYTVNGVSINNPYDQSRGVNIAPNAVQELSVVSGTFNAEYGNAQSGVVNTVTKEGGRSYHLTTTVYFGDRLSNNTEIYPGIGNYDPLNHIVAEGTLSGPVPGIEEYLTLFGSVRYDRSRGWLQGTRQQNPTDYVYKNPLNPNDMTVISTGDGATVPMNPSTDLSLTGKLSFTPTATIKLRGDIIYSNSEYQFYSHDLRYNPDANYLNFDEGILGALEWRHTLSSSTYYTVRGSYNVNDFKQYLYPLLDSNGNEIDFWAGAPLDTSQIHPDARYQPDYKLVLPSNHTFLLGGTLNGHTYQRTRTGAAKFDMTSQITSSHEVKGGIEYFNHQIDYRSFSVLRDTVRYFQPTIPGTNTVSHTSYLKLPQQLSAYLQDKMEFESIILNVGLRYDYFNPRAEYAPDIFQPSPNAEYEDLNGNGVWDPGEPSPLVTDASPKHQWSPRVGVSFPITDRGIIHFSYGHFFQMPPFRYLYTNPNFKANFSTGRPTFGNANLNPERTVTYELGLQQQLAEKVAVNITGFYKDVRDLLALQQIRISGDETYFRYINKDYANIKGITLSLIKRRTRGDLLGITLDYTFQVAEGNEVSADAFFLDLSSGRQSEKIPVYLSWDQTHTLYGTVALGQPNDWNVTVVGRFGTGLPYTPQELNRTIYLGTNSDRKPEQASVDLLADKTFDLGGFGLTVFLKVYNLFDTLNERIVYNDTGRATYTLQSTLAPAQATNRFAMTVPGVHSADEYFVHPGYYSSPRQLRFGMTLEF